jgi:hypothetical protein
MGRYVLIPLKDTALNIGAVALECGARELGDGQRDALAQAFECTLQTCELLVTYAVGCRGKPSSQ